MSGSNTIVRVGRKLLLVACQAWSLIWVYSYRRKIYICNWTLYQLRKSACGNEFTLNLFRSPLQQTYERVTVENSRVHCFFKKIIFSSQKLCKFIFITLVIFIDFITLVISITLHYDNWRTILASELCYITIKH